MEFDGLGLDTVASNCSLGSEQEKMLGSEWAGRRRRAASAKVQKYPEGVPALPYL